MPVNFSVRTRSTILRNDVDGDNRADAGDILRHTVTITNTGTDAVDVTINDDLLGSDFTSVLNISPIAFNDAYNVTGNTLFEVGNATAQTGPQQSFAGNLLSNDVEFLGDTFTISAFQAASANGGTVSVVTSGIDTGSFTYISAAGFEGTDTFTYTIRDDGIDNIAGNADDLVSTATVTLTVGGATNGQVWYVDSAAAPGGTGTSTNPFNRSRRSTRRSPSMRTTSSMSVATPPTAI